MHYLKTHFHTNIEQIDLENFEWVSSLGKMYFSIIQTNKLGISFKSTPWTPKPKICGGNHSLVKVLLDSKPLRTFLDIAKIIATPTKARCAVLKKTT